MGAMGDFIQGIGTGTPVAGVLLLVALIVWLVLKKKDGGGTNLTIQQKQDANSGRNVNGNGGACHAVLDPSVREIARATNGIERSNALLAQILAGVAQRQAEDTAVLRQIREDTLLLRSKREGD